MIITKNPNIVYLSFTKCGSSSMYALLKNNLNVVKAKSKGHKKIDEQYLDTHTILTVSRNPYSRMVSWWNSAIRGDPQDRYKHKEELKRASLTQSFDDFCYLWCNIKKVPSQYDSIFIYNPTLKNIKNIKLENLNNEICEFLNINVDIPSRNSRLDSNEYKKYLTDRSISIINNYYKKDFEYFGYEIK